MKVNGELKILWGMSLIILAYIAYLCGTPNPEDGTLLMAIITPIVVLATGIGTREYIKRRILLD